MNQTFTQSHLNSFQFLSLSSSSCLCFFLNHSVSFISPCPGSMLIFSSTAAVSSSPLQPSGPFLSSLIPASQALPTRPWFHQHLHKISSPRFQFSLQPQQKQSIFSPLIQIGFSPQCCKSESNCKHRDDRS